MARFYKAKKKENKVPTDHIRELQPNDSSELFAEAAEEVISAARSAAVRAAGLPEGSPLGDVPRHYTKQAEHTLAEAAGLPAGSSLSEISASFRSRANGVLARAAGLDDDASLSDIRHALASDAREKAEAERQKFNDEVAKEMGLPAGATRRQIAQAQVATELGLPPTASMEEIINQDRQ